MSVPAPAAAEAPTLPIRAFFRHADMDGAQLSPSGRWLAVATGAEGKRVALAVVDLEGKQPIAIVANFSDADIRSFRWVNDERLVYNTLDRESGNGEQRFGPGLLSVRRDGTETRLLIRLEGNFLREARVASREVLSFKHELLAVPRGGGDEVIVGAYQLDGQYDVRSVNALRLNVVTGRTTSLSEGIPDHVIRWWFDPRGNPRLVLTQDQGNGALWWRGPADQAWRRLAAFAASSAPFVPQFVDELGRLYVSESDSGRGTSQLKRFDFNTGKPETKAIISTPGFDFSGNIRTDEEGSRLLGITVETDAAQTLWFDPALQALQKLVDARFPGHVNLLSCNRCTDPQVVLVASYSDRDPGSYWIYRPPTAAWEAIGQVRKDIEPGSMAPLDFHRIKARDGEDLPLWVTARPAAKETPPRPAVLLVHGGPWVRGTAWGWHGAAQFLASRGYVVIEPEFRGSTGFGRQHFEKGWKHWGDTMQDDLADAVAWAAGRGLIDPKRVCIAGASYGGYATLMSLIAHPEGYRCGVAWVAVTDPRLLFEASWASDSSEEIRRYQLPLMLGDPVADAAMLARAAPVERAAEIRAPLLLAFGRDDRRVPLEHGSRIRSALRAAGREPDYVVYEGEGHGWLKTENQLDWWGRVERFLDKNLRQSPAR
ncbi:MAG: prolyl oligopeptidase family serine peptidase [Pseudomonadota bacterium]|nr:prolyl oligopeptidase family serine peptidase [Pseudomonadota bacterium]